MMTFTCISCHVAFKEPNIQREHYKTDWHRYNLKRKVVDLPPVTAEGKKMSKDFHKWKLNQRNCK
jgi:pre-60S factor REI1